MKTIYSPLVILLFLFCTSPENKLTSSAQPVQNQETAAKPSPRSGHCLIYDEQLRKVVLLDGYQPPYQPELGEIWSWDGKQWELIPGSGPTARSLSGAVYVSHLRRIVSYGGVGNRGYADLRGDSWEWDGKSWHQLADTSVGTRDHHVMAYDASRGKTVLYGGLTSSRTFVTDTWEWDGAKWSKIVASGPGGRAHFAMVYDSIRKRVVLFGGYSEDRIYHNDTWTWDGTTWQQVSDEGPPPRARHRMAFDSRAGSVLLYGGGNKEGQLGDMWQWDGKRWTEIKITGPSPGKRFMHAMAYDAARGKTVLYGGNSEDKSSDDTWEWDGKKWARTK